MRIARVYDETQTGEQRVLVDRLWPRGISKADDRVGTWLPHVAPSQELRSWYQHDEARHDEFAQRYAAELDAKSDDEEMVRLRALAQNPECVVVTATRDLALSHVPILVEYLGADPVPEVLVDDPINTLERWELFGGAWQVRKRDSAHAEIDLLRCDGGERVDSLASDDPTFLAWLDKHEA